MRSSTRARVSASADCAAGDAEDSDGDAADDDDEPSVSPNSAAPAAASAITAGNFGPFVDDRFDDSLGDPCGDRGRPRATRGVGLGMASP